MNSSSPGKRTGTFLSVIAVLALNIGIVAPAAVLGAGGNPSASLAQCANDSFPSPNTDGCSASANDWVNGNVGASKAFYTEGDSLPYRLVMDNLSLASHTVIVEWDTTKSGKHALDYITTFNRTVATANPCLGISNCTTSTTFPIPSDPQVTGAGVTPVAGNFTLYGGTITAVSPYSYSNGTGFTGDKSARLAITFTATKVNPVLAWAGHIATRLDWGTGGSAVAISGSPYHTRLISLDGSGGNQDRSLSADAVIFPAHVTVIKHADVPGATAFGFTATGLTPTSFSLTDNSSSTDPSQGFGDITTFGSKTVAESSPLPGYRLSTITCSEDANQNTTTSVGAGGAGGTASISLEEGETVSCTFTNTANISSLSIDKVATEAGFSAVGDVIHYTITATNTGNTTLAAVTVTDPNATGLSCTPANGSSLAPGASLSCTATHTITQADIDAGSFYNQACVDDGAGGAASQCDDVTTPGTKNPALSIVKDVTETSYDSVGDIVHYTITATNTGNTTLAAVTITDTEAVLGTCTPLNGSSLAPGATLTCAATHTVTQADIDAGTYNNTACVDDGAGGATEKCDDADVDADQNPSLTIDKTDLSTTKYAHVGDIINYSIVATNTGNTTLAAVTITDADAVLGTCTPANGSPLAPGATMTCPASHTITQADITAGSYKNTACVDDGAGGAASQCDDVTTPGKAHPSVATTDTLLPQDSIVMSGLTAGATGDLYVELRINENCDQDDSPAYSKTWSGTISNTIPYVTANTVTVSDDATVRWCVSYSGDANNAEIPLSEHGEVAEIDFEPFVAGAIGAGFAIPLLLLGFWNRKRRQSEA